MFLGTVWACDDCTFQVANGEHDPDRPADLPPVLALILDGQRLLLGLAADEHADTCTPADRAENQCDCESIPFSTTSCETCGDHHAGTRHALTLDQDDRYRTLSTAELSDEDGCPTCGDQPRAATLHFEDRGPFQQISHRHMRCRNGHRWTRETDGG
jgi:hypothetical protein